MSVVKRGIVKSYDAAAHKAAVQIAGSLGVWLDDVRVATDIPAADVIAGRQCTVLFLDPSNQDDALVLTIQGALPSAGGGGVTDQHAPIGGYYPGVLSTGIKTTPQVPYKGNGFTMATFYCRVAVAPSGAAITVQLRRNGSNLGSVATIAISAKTGSVAISQAIADTDYFDIDITQVGTTPNEGSDLVWLIVP